MCLLWLPKHQMTMEKDSTAMLRGRIIDIGKSFWYRCCRVCRKKVGSCSTFRSPAMLLRTSASPCTDKIRATARCEHCGSYQPTWNYYLRITVAFNQSSVVTLSLFDEQLRSIFGTPAWSYARFLKSLANEYCAQRRLLQLTFRALQSLLLDHEFDFVREYRRCVTPRYVLDLRSTAASSKRTLCTVQNLVQKAHFHRERDETHRNPHNRKLLVKQVRKSLHRSFVEKQRRHESISESLW